MKKLIWSLVIVACSAGYAQTPLIGQDSDLLKNMDSFDLTAAEAKSSQTSAASTSKKAVAKSEVQQKGPTEITSTKEATFDNKTRQAMFTGNVQVKDPEFTITCEKLTAFLHDTAASKAAAAPKTSAPPAASRSKGNGGGTAGGLDRAVAEGKVTIIQEKPGENGGPMKR